MARMRVAVLISGRGSNMAALVRAAQAPDYPAEIVLVLSDKPDAAGLAFASDAGIEALPIDRKGFAGKADFEAAITAALTARQIELVCLAGFMRLLSADFVERWRDRLINIHPSLLPSFRGLDTHERALAAGVRIHGCTVHFVRAATDDGPIIIQAAVPVLDGDTAETLQHRVLAAEHDIYPRALALVAGGHARVEGERVVLPDMAMSEGRPLISPAA